MKGRRRQRNTPKVFGSVKTRAEATTAHMQTARGMMHDPQQGLRAAVGHLVTCGWHLETAQNWLRPDPRNRIAVEEEA